MSIKSFSHSFSQISTSKVDNNLLLEYLVIGGGGGGGAEQGGGGGAGGYLTGSVLVPKGFNLPVTVGAGGFGGCNKSQVSTSVPSTSGNNSQFYTKIAYGGGHGQHLASVNSAGNGGSGG